jgi:hypothetical protein
MPGTYSHRYRRAQVSSAALVPARCRSSAGVARRRYRRSSAPFVAHSVLHPVALTSSAYTSVRMKIIACRTRPVNCRNTTARSSRTVSGLSCPARVASRISASAMTVASQVIPESSGPYRARRGRLHILVRSAWKVRRYSRRVTDSELRTPRAAAASTCPLSCTHTRAMARAVSARMFASWVRNGKPSRNDGTSRGCATSSARPTRMTTAYPVHAAGANSSLPARSPTGRPWSTGGSPAPGSGNNPSSASTARKSTTSTGSPTSSTARRSHSSIPHPC